MKDMILQEDFQMEFLKENPHGIEQLNTVTDAIQEMMMQSYEGLYVSSRYGQEKTHPNAFISEDFVHGEDLKWMPA